MTYRDVRRLLSGVALLLAAPMAHAEEVENTSPSSWDIIRAEGLEPNHTYAVSSGSGFFVDAHHVVTNAHVVRGCKSVALRGAVEPVGARLVAADEANDLAVLYSPTAPRRVASLRLRAQIREGDAIVLGGYPLDRSQTGRLLVTSGKVVMIQAEEGDLKRMEISNATEIGNSGGPVVDENGDLVGVVSQKLMQYQRTIEFKDGTFQMVTDTAPEKMIAQRGVAIGVDVLEHFLVRHGIPFRAVSSYGVLDRRNPEESMGEYLVNIHCIQDRKS